MCVCVSPAWFDRYIQRLSQNTDGEEEYNGGTIDMNDDPAKMDADSLVQVASYLDCHKDCQCGLPL